MTDAAFRQLRALAIDLVEQQGFSDGDIAEVVAHWAGQLTGLTGDALRESFEEGLALGRGRLVAHCAELEAENAALRVQVRRFATGQEIDSDFLTQEDLDNLPEVNE